MFISQAWAEESVSVVPEAAQSLAQSSDPIIMNVGMILFLAVMFYFLLIRPQQKRFKEHASMINKLDRGSKVVTQGGLVGTIDKVISDHEVQVDFGGGVKINMMRSYIIGRYEDSLPQNTQPANDTKSKKDKSNP
ncbi:MAG: preprotein translocase subunit YajC [Pseudobdellovibrionaceae bacterium]